MKRDMVLEGLIAGKFTEAVNDNLEMPLLHQAVFDGDETRVLNLLAKRASVDLQNNIEETALHVAVAKGYSKLVLLLLEYKADPNIANASGNNALHIALQQGSKVDDNIVEMLVSSGGDLHQKNDYGFSPLHFMKEKWRSFDDVTNRDYRRFSQEKREGICITDTDIRSGLYGALAIANAFPEFVNNINPN